MQTKLIFLRGDGLVSRSAMRENEKGQKTNAFYGTRCLEQYKKLNRNLSSEKMYLVSQILTADWYSRRCALTWKLKGTKFSRLLFQLVPKTHRTDEIGAGSLLLKTPCTADAYTENHEQERAEVRQFGNISTRSADGIYLSEGDATNSQRKRLEGHDWKWKRFSINRSNERVFVRSKNKFVFTNTTAMDSSNATATMKSTQVKEGSMHSVTLVRAMAMGMLPTPTSGSQNSQHSIAEWGGSGNNMRKIPGSFSPLNPRFVAEMMGFPPNWTELPFLNGEQNQLRVTETP
jgi:hypothetical protein